MLFQITETASKQVQLDTGYELVNGPCVCAKADLIASKTIFAGMELYCTASYCSGTLPSCVILFFIAH